MADGTGRDWLAERDQAATRGKRMRHLNVVRFGGQPRRRVRRRGPPPPAAPSGRPAAASGRRTLRRGPAAPRPGRPPAPARTPTVASASDRVGGQPGLGGLTQPEPGRHQSRRAGTRPTAAAAAGAVVVDGGRPAATPVRPRRSSASSSVGRPGLRADRARRRRPFARADDDRQVAWTGRGPRRRAPLRCHRAPGREDLRAQLGLRRVSHGVHDDTVQAVDQAMA